MRQHHLCPDVALFLHKEDTCRAPSLGKFKFSFPSDNKTTMNWIKLAINWAKTCHGNLCMMSRNSSHASILILWSSWCGRSTEISDCQVKLCLALHAHAEFLKPDIQSDIYNNVAVIKLFNFLSCELISRLCRMICGMLWKVAGW